MLAAQQQLNGAGSWQRRNRHPQMAGASGIAARWATHCLRPYGPLALAAQPLWPTMLPLRRALPAPTQHSAAKLGRAGQRRVPVPVLKEQASADGVSMLQQRGHRAQSRRSRPHPRLARFTGAQLSTPSAGWHPPTSSPAQQSIIGAAVTAAAACASALRQQTSCSTASARWHSACQRTATASPPANACMPRQLGAHAQTSMRAHQMPHTPLTAAAPGLGPAAAWGEGEGGALGVIPRAFNATSV